MPILIDSFMPAAAAAGFLGDDWQDGVAVIGVSITVLGFAAAIWQIRRAASSAQAALSASQLTREELLKNLQLADLSTAIRLATEIQVLIGAQQFGAGGLRLHDLRGFIVQIAATGDHDAKTERRFHNSLARVTILQRALLEQHHDSSKPIDPPEAQTTLIEVSDFLNELATRTRLRTGGADATP